MQWSGQLCPDMNAVSQTGTVPGWFRFGSQSISTACPRHHTRIGYRDAGYLALENRAMLVRAFRSRTGSVRCLVGLGLGWLVALALAGCLVHPPDRAGTALLSPAPSVPTFTPTATPAFAPNLARTPTPVLSPIPSLTVSEDYDNQAEHANGRYELELSGTRVAATLSTSRSPVEHWARMGLQPLFTVPEPFRPSYPVLRTVEGRPVHADGTPDAARTAPHHFLLRVDPDGGVHYVDDIRVEGVGHLAYVLHTAWDTTLPPAAPTFTPPPPPWPTPTFVHAVPSPTPSLTVSGTYDNRVEHTDGRYVLQLSGSRVSASFSTTRSPVQYWAREVAAPLLTVPEPFRPPYPVLRTAVGRTVRADGTPDPDHLEPRRFLLRVDPGGVVHYVDDARVEGEDQQAYCLNLVGLTGLGITTASLNPSAGIVTGTLRAPAGAGQPPPPSSCAASPGHAGRFLAYALHTTWGTTPIANDRAVLEILDRHWFGETLLSAEPPPVQFEVPEHSEHMRGTFPAARVGAFVTFDADGRVKALGAPTNELKRVAGAPVYNFNGPLLPELGQLHHLEHLDLGYRTYFERDAKHRSVGRGPDSLTGAIPPQLWRLPRLRHLDLQGQLLAWILPSDMGRLASLEYLDLGNNWLSGPLPPELERLASLKHLDLSGNDFTEPLPPALGRLARLQRLDLSGNNLTALPPALGQLPNLQHLNLSSNNLTTLPPTLGQLPNLQHLNLSSNDLTTLPPTLGQLPNLQHLNLSGNDLTALPPALGQLPNLQHLNLSGNNLTALPPALGQLPNLQHLNLSSNDLTALPPEWGQLASLEYLYLGGNGLTGPLPSEWGQLASLEYLYLGGNGLTGPLPSEWGQLASLEVLHMSGHQLTGSLPPEWGQLAHLQWLNLSDNQLTGPLPSEWGQLANLRWLQLRGNQLTGLLPSEWGQLARLWRLTLSDNQLTGPLPSEWGQLARLEELSLSDNQLTGPLPLEWTRMTNLRYLNVSGNRLTGCYPGIYFPNLPNNGGDSIYTDLPDCPLIQIYRDTWPRG